MTECYVDQLGGSEMTAEENELWHLSCIQQLRNLLNEDAVSEFRKQVACDLESDDTDPLLFPDILSRDLYLAKNLYSISGDDYKITFLDDNFAAVPEIATEKKSAVCNCDFRSKRNSSEWLGLIEKNISSYLQNNYPQGEHVLLDKLKQLFVFQSYILAQRRKAAHFFNLVCQYFLPKDNMIAVPEVHGLSNHENVPFYSGSSIRAGSGGDTATVNHAENNILQRNKAGQEDRHKVSDSNQSDLLGENNKLIRERNMIEIYCEESMASMQRKIDALEGELKLKDSRCKFLETTIKNCTEKSNQQLQELQTKLNVQRKEFEVENCIQSKNMVALAQSMNAFVKTMDKFAWRPVEMRCFGGESSTKLIEDMRRLMDECNSVLQQEWDAAEMAANRLSGLLRGTMKRQILTNGDRVTDRNKTFAAKLVTAVDALGIALERLRRFEHTGAKLRMESEARKTLILISGFLPDLLLALIILKSNSTRVSSNSMLEWFKYFSFVIIDNDTVQ
ncbi:unnamed protein product [Soboliphyme baturini]|uniref:Uncharacterized protein n=1 Tax=Soboliphyme baturini TaxID=241478 RepID=A0A183IXH7_9BILA|nr:unnamed protein product [Soboliphyme baturini]